MPAAAAIPPPPPGATEAVTVEPFNPKLTPFPSLNWMVCRFPEVVPALTLIAPPPPGEGADNARFRPLLSNPTVADTLVPANVVPVPANLVVLALGKALLVIAEVLLVCWNNDDTEVLIALLVIAEVLLNGCREWLNATWPAELRNVTSLFWFENARVEKLLEPPEAEKATGWTDCTGEVVRNAGTPSEIPPVPSVPTTAVPAVVVDVNPTPAMLPEGWV